MQHIYLDESIQNYLAWLKEIKKTPYHTFRAYQIDLIQFLKYFLREEKNDLPSREDIEAYLETIKGKFNYSSYRRKVSALRNFIRYLVDSGINVPDPLMSISLPMPEVNFNIPIKYEDILGLINSLPENTENEIRDKIIFSLTAKCGLTIKQLLAIKIKDINLASSQIIISKDHLTFLDEATVKLIEKFFGVLNKRSSLALDDYLLANHVKSSKIPLSTRTINLIVDKTAQERNFHARLSPTILRRLFAKSLNENNLNKNTRKLLLGKTCRLVS